MKLLLGLLLIVNSLLIAAMHEPLNNASKPPEFQTLFRIIQATQNKNDKKVPKTSDHSTDTPSKKVKDEK